MDSKDIALIQKLAKSKTSFGGKRLLGYTSSGAEVWASYTLHKDGLKLVIKTSHDLGVLLKEGSTFARKRVTVANNKSFPSKAGIRNSKVDYGEITLRSIDYLKKLIQICETQINTANGKCTKSLFMKISNFLYEGGTESGEVRWTDIIEVWELPEGKYQNVYG